MAGLSVRKAAYEGHGQKADVHVGAKVGVEGVGLKGQVGERSCGQQNSPMAQGSGERDGSEIQNHAARGDESDDDDVKNVIQGELD